MFSSCVNGVSFSLLPMAVLSDDRRVAQIKPRVLLDVLLIERPELSCLSIAEAVGEMSVSGYCSRSVLSDSLNFSSSFSVT